MVKVKQTLHEQEGTPLKTWFSMSSTDTGIKHYVTAFLISQGAEETTDEVDIENDVVFVCSCKGSQYAGTCWHRDDAMELFEKWWEETNDPKK